MGGGRRSPRELLTPAALQILMVLATGDLHGYGIKQAVESRSGGALRLGPGTLYEAVHRMEADGWIRVVSSPGGGDGRRRKVYRITAAGRRVMEQELRRLGELLRFADREEILPADTRTALRGALAVPSAGPGAGDDS